MFVSLRLRSDYKKPFFRIVSRVRSSRRSCRYLYVLGSKMLTKIRQNDPAVQAGKETAFKDSVDWFHKYL